MKAERFVEIYKDKSIIKEDTFTPRNLGRDGFEVEVSIPNKDMIIASAKQNGVKDVLLIETDGYAVIRFFDEDDRGLSNE